ncbi:hypothetical protein [Luteibacter yeojuensis]|uniref:Uncharacterized protein n=1 Tax=Luteibacter yeojuensis TaxID=345309 RepID=A0A7X5TN74_9GAMM|nr:hypothetical protein [Luteibacter yeojuensis]NID14371.1 hypothetical protein [Luteibacter yeojuensis]
MKKLLLEVSSLGTSTSGESLPYEVEIHGQTVSGRLSGKCETPYRRFVAYIDDGMDYRLKTSDARLSLTTVEHA